MDIEDILDELEDDDDLTVVCPKCGWEGGESVDPTTWRCDECGYQWPKGGD
jgi:ribosomal protein L37AE/L43A